MIFRVYSRLKPSSVRRRLGLEVLNLYKVLPHISNKLPTLRMNWNRKMCWNLEIVVKTRRKNHFINWTKNRNKTLYLKKRLKSAFTKWNSWNELLSGSRPLRSGPALRPFWRSDQIWPVIRLGRSSLIGSGSGSGSEEQTGDDWFWSEFSWWLEIWNVRTRTRTWPKRIFFIWMLYFRRMFRKRLKTGFHQLFINLKIRIRKVWFKQ